MPAECAPPSKEVDNTKELPRTRSGRRRRTKQTQDSLTDASADVSTNAIINAAFDRPPAYKTTATTSGRWRDEWGVQTQNCSTQTEAMSAYPRSMAFATVDPGASATATSPSAWLNESEEESQLEIEVKALEEAGVTADRSDLANLCTCRSAGAAPTFCSLMLSSSLEL